VNACPEDVFIKSNLERRHHVHVKDPSACTGCKKCVRACEYDAIVYTYVPAPKRAAKPNPPGAGDQAEAPE